MTRDCSLDSMVERDWHKIDEQLAHRGEVVADLSWIAAWDEELAAMNARKNGRPYRFPRSLVRFVRLLREVWHLGLRQAEGLLRALGEALAFDVPDYTTLWHRLVRDEADTVVPPRHDGMVLAIDSTGLAVTQRGEWLRDRWHVHRGFVKAHVAVDVTTATVAAVMVSDDRTHDRGFLIPLVRQAQRLGTVKRVLADGAYDTHDNFDFLRREGIEAGIKTRKNANQHMRGGTFARPLAVGERERLGEDGRSRKYEYSLRWKVEVVFSAVKRTLGEALRARRSDLMLREAQQKFIVYNRLATA